jgi:hypothetical protein
MKERYIAKQTVIKSIEEPDKIERSAYDKCRILFKKIYFNKTLKRDHLLMAICEIRGKAIIVITIIDTSKISKYF